MPSCLLAWEAAPSAPFPDNLMTLTFYLASELVKHAESIQVIFTHKKAYDLIRCGRREEGKKVSDPSD